MKRCARCLKALPRSDFNRSQSYCRPCQREYNREWRDRNPERMRAIRQRIATKQRKTRQSKTPEQRRAQWAVYCALKTGKLIRPDVCPCCRRLVRVDAHHADYSKPLDVEWLCRRCHARRHADRLLGLSI